MKISLSAPHSCMILYTQCSRICDFFVGAKARHVARKMPNDDTAEDANGLPRHSKLTAKQVGLLLPSSNVQSPGS